MLYLWTWGHWVLKRMIKVAILSVSVGNLAIFSSFMQTFSVIKQERETGTVWLSKKKKKHHMDCRGGKGWCSYNLIVEGVNIYFFPRTSNAPLPRTAAEPSPGNYRRVILGITSVISRHWASRGCRTAAVIGRESRVGPVTSTVKGRKHVIFMLNN